MRALKVDLGERSYPIEIGPDIVSSERLKALIAGRQVLLVTNDTIAALYLDQVRSELNDFDVVSVILPDGEEYKKLETLDQIYTTALTHRFSRNATFIALGGGVVGDMVGFAAATYQRGVPFIQIPTTLLAQVDSSVGGKTGVNHPLGKNMIGSFYQPLAVLIDTAMLETLPPREVSAGLAEIIKYGLLGDFDFLSWTEVNIDELKAKNKEYLAEAIERACQMKANIVMRDELEGDIRALLNLGHTFGHAIEAHLSYGTWLHGEAVSVGMVLASKLSHHLGYLNEADVRKVISLCERAGLPSKPPKGMVVEDFIEHMAVDKKSIDGRIRLILMRALGHAYIEESIETDALFSVIASCCH